MKNQYPKVAAIQLTSTDNVENNLAQTGELISEATHQNADLVLLPENFAVFDSKALAYWAQPKNCGILLDRLKVWAYEHQLWIVAGSLPCSVTEPKSDKHLVGKVRATSIVISPTGIIYSKYDKIHLFDVNVNDEQGCYRESDTIARGTTPTMSIIDSLNLSLGLSICYDLRFPELYRLLRAKGANVFTVPSAFTFKTGQAHWEVLLRARAIENQCYVIAANQTGQNSSKRHTWGHSMIIDPWGDILDCIESGPGIAFAEINLEKQKQLRQSMPVEKHRVF